jgi:hypothetical protein
MVLLEHVLANRELQDENRRLREELADTKRFLALAEGLIDADRRAAKAEPFPKDTCLGCGGPRGADGLFRHTRHDCPVIGVRNGS